MNAAKNRSFFVPVSLFLGAALCQSSAFAQPKLAPDAPRRAPAFSVAELEQFLGGRTLVTLDLKDATLEQVAAALSQASNQKIEARPPAPARRVMAPGAGGAAPLFTFSTSKTPFWEALRAWQIEAREANEVVAEAAIGDVAATVPVRNASAIVPNSLGLTRNTAGWWTQPDDSLVDGRAVATWPFLVIATDLKRSQDASLTQTSLRDTSRGVKPIVLSSAATAARGAAAPRLLPKMFTPEIERWSDRLTLSGQVLIDPKLLPSALRCEVLEAKDDQGNDLRYAGEFALRKFTPPLGSSDDLRSLNSGLGFEIPLRSKPAMGKRLIKLRGVLRFNVVTHSQHWETTQLDKPIGGAIFQNGGEFGVQFDGLEKSGSSDMLIARFSAQSRGAHLERMWRDRPATATIMRGTNDWSSSGSGQNFASSFVVGDAIGGGGSWGNILDFQGTPNMTLVDENGLEFNLSPGLQITKLERNAPGAPSTTIPTPDISPQPPEDVAQNWNYTEKRSIYFHTPYDPVARDRAKMGRPAKLVLDLPLERREVVVPFEFTNLPLPPS